jgi:hypothetical protein
MFSLITYRNGHLCTHRLRSISVVSDTNAEREALVADNNPEPAEKGDSLLRPGYITTSRIILYFLSTVAALSVVLTAIIIVLTTLNIKGQTYSTYVYPNPQSYNYESYSMILAPSLIMVPSLIVMDGACSSVRIYNVLAHLILNAIGTLVLGASNYLQQICTSPTAKHVDSVQGNIKFGSNMPGELFKRSGTQMKLFWILLISTSVLIHVIINGIAGYEVVDPHPFANAITMSSDIGTILGHNDTQYTTVGPSACVGYIDEFWGGVSDFTNITVVLKSESKVEYYLEIFSGFNGPNAAEAEDISHCYLRLVQAECRIGVRWIQLITLSIILVAKSCVVHFFVRQITRTLRSERLFYSVGDFIVLGANGPTFHIAKGSSLPGPNRKVRTRWVATLGPRDLLIWIFWFSSSVMGATFLGIGGWLRNSDGKSLAAFARAYPIGSTRLSINTYILGANDAGFLMLTMMLANLPQLWVSACYLLWNNQLTRIWMEHEWRSYHRRRKIPRISHDADKVNGVRATRFLQLPYAATAFLMTTSTILHLLVSQAIFVSGGIDQFPFEAVIGAAVIVWSPLAVLILGSITIILLLVTTIYYFWPFRTAMPVMAGSARIVLDACFQLEESLPASGIQWGDISTEKEWIAGFGEIVAELTDGVTYPGEKETEEILD